jgi:hypothetical protein
MTKDEVLKMALEALEYHTLQTRPIIETMATISVIKEALAQQDAEDHLQAIADFGQEQEQCLDCGSNNLGVPANYDSLITSVQLDHIANAGKKVAQPEQEPVAWGIKKQYGMVWFVNDSRSVCQGYANYYQHRDASGSNQEAVPLYTSPPKRYWVGASDLDRANLWHQDPKIAMAALEQFLKLANT